MTNAQPTPVPRQLSPDKASLLLCILLMAELCCLAPYSLNPDGHFYYGVALRLSKGEFLASIDGLYSPLLSWLMAPLVFSGISLPGAYRIINFLCFVVVAQSTYSISKELRMTSLQIGFILTLTTALFITNTVFVVTSDVLAAACFLCTLVFAVRLKANPPISDWAILGSLGGICYYAKAVQLLVFLLFVALIALVFWQRLGARGLSRLEVIKPIISVFFAALVVAPWLSLLEKKYGAVTLSGQELVMYHHVELRDYHPDTIGRILRLQGESEANKAQRSLQAPLAATIKSAVLAIPTRAYLTATTVIQEFYLSVGGLGFCLLPGLFGIGLLEALRRRQIRESVWTLYLAIAAHVVVYFLTWGGRFRYYLPVLPLILILCAGPPNIPDPNESKDVDEQPSRRLRALISSFAWAIIIATGYHSAIRYQLAEQSVPPQIVAAILNLDSVRNTKGAMTGRLFDPFSGQVAALQKREYWNSIDPMRGEDSTTLSRKLDQWGIEQIIWMGPTFEPLNQLPDFRPSYVGTVAGQNVRIYNRVH